MTKTIGEKMQSWDKEIKDAGVIEAPKETEQLSMLAEAVSVVIKVPKEKVYSALCDLIENEKR